ncbi:hypothetical protein D3879_19335 [Pseudomonas cavernicola]|uniref:Uncharacterized protein n=1 Tax=Pseudomonas cavernicola TaxID=2320866 RepID=A0A418XCX9_9PSED|nr:YMGG-like glycine zipper-containing protein [Pseudomonas cavernicola]RJG10183.1 hypothetical protein D3879_19335 [Pseudomonas cavernicola]
MNRLSSLCLCVALSGGSVQVQAETVVPLQGQSSQQIQQDVADCQNIAAGSTGSTSSTTQGGGRLRGAAAGAAAGAVGAQVRGNQHEEVYDRVDDDVQQEYRQNRAKETAAAGAVVGGSRQRQERRQDSANAGEVDSTAYTSCLQGRGYQVTP